MNSKHKKPRPAAGGMSMSPAIQRSSTILFDDLDAFEAAAEKRFEVAYYGRYGTSTSFELEKQVAILEGADKTYAVSSGHAAITAALLAFLSPGDHVLLPEGVYEPTKTLALGLLRQFGVIAEVYPNRVGTDIARYCKDSTRLIWIEAPCSLTYAIPEIDDIVAYAAQKGITTIADNSWASSLLLQPLKKGIDISVLSATKYMSGHADAIGGFISVPAKHRPSVERALTALGASLSPDSAYLIWRGLQTMDLRLQRQAQSAMAVATALCEDSRISEVFYPALPHSLDYSRWRKYFSGANGLLSFSILNVSRAAIADFVSALKVLYLGVSFGGIESLIYPKNITGIKAHSSGSSSSWLLRLSVGLGEPNEILEDLDRGLSRMRR